jgi:hypothetical protein
MFATYELTKRQFAHAQARQMLLPLTAAKSY